MCFAPSLFFSLMQQEFRLSSFSVRTLLLVSGGWWWWRCAFSSDRLLRGCALRKLEGVPMS